MLMADIPAIPQSFSDTVTNFEPNNVFNIFSNPIFTKILFFGKILFYFALAVFGVILIYKFWLQYKVKITIKSKVGGGGFEVKHDRAKVIIDSQNKTKLQLLKLRKGRKAITCPIPASIYKSKIGKNDHYELWLDDNYQLHPVENTLADSKGEVLMRIRPQERDAWARMEDKNLADKYKKKDMFDKYLPAGILMIAMITAFLIWFFAAKNLGTGLSQLASQFAQVASNCVSIRGG